MPVTLNRILWPTDFSELSLHGGRYARELRQAFAAELHIIHVIPPPLSPDVAVLLPADVPLSMTEPELVRACRTGLERLIGEHFGGDPAVKFDAFYGNPWSSICDYAQRKEIDLLVISTHGRTGLRRALIGSTAETIVRHAPCPVLTVKIAEKEFVNQ